MLHAHWPHFRVTSGYNTGGISESWVGKLRVGQIEIDGSSIRIHSQGQSISFQGQASSAGANVPQPTADELLERLPLPAGALYALGGLLVIAGLGAALVLGQAGSIASYLAYGTPISAGLMVSVLGFLKSRAARGPAAASQVAVDASVLSQRFARLSPYLRDGDADTTVESLMEATGMTEAALVSTLAVLCERGDVAEDLNMDTGQWFYRLPEPATGEGVPRSALPAAERSVNLEEQMEIKR